ncbi:MAG: host attachment protein [Gammaproteobacteria bacterium]
MAADSARARFFVSPSPRSPLQEIETLMNPEARMHEQALISDSPGRSFDSAGQGRHALEKKVEPKRQLLQGFAKRIAQRLEQARRSGQFEALVIIAAPDVLGSLRKHLRDTTSRVITLELDKNVTQMHAEEIRQRLPELLPTHTA